MNVGATEGLTDDEGAEVGATHVGATHVVGLVVEIDEVVLTYVGAAEVA